MKVALLILAFAFTAQAARVAGMVRSITGEAIPRAMVHLASRSVIADDGGTFVFENVEPGTYPLGADRPGFVPARYGARSATAPGIPVTVEPGATVDGLVITLTPQGVLSGRVTDQKGDPVAGAHIWVLRRGYQGGIRQLLPTPAESTDDQGRFRIAGLTPGRYYVLALPPEEGIAGGRTGSMRTYYPNAADAQTALPLDVTPGVDLAGIDIRLRAGPLYAIRGRVDLSADPGERVSVSAVPTDGITGLGIGVPAGPPDFTFELRDLVPGQYIIRTIARAFRDGEPSMRLGRATEVTVAGHVNGLVVVADTSVSIQGRVLIEDGDTQTPIGPFDGGPRPISVRAISDPTRAATGVKEDGTFLAMGLSPGKYRLILGAFPEGVYVKSARFGDQDALHDEIDLSSGRSGELTIVVSKKSAEVTGTIPGEKTVGRMVTLWTREPEPYSLTNGVRTAYTDREGAVRFGGLPPGDYLAAAWEEADAQLVLSRDFLREFASEAASMTLAEGGRVAIEAKLIPTEKIKAAEAKLP